MGNLVKGVTLLFFIVSITVFVAYKSGYLNSEQESNIYGQVVTDTLPDNQSVKALDTLPNLDSTALRNVLLPGSKSMRIVDPKETKPRLDSLQLDSVKIE